MSKKKFICGALAVILLLCLAVALLGCLAENISVLPVDADSKIAFASAKNNSAKEGDDSEAELNALKAIEAINATSPTYYAKQKGARGSFLYKNINGADVTVDLLKNQPGEGKLYFTEPDGFRAPKLLYNQSFAMGEIIFNTIRYKLAHPEEDVELRLSSYHVSIICGLCLDKSNPRYGTMHSIFNDANGEVNMIFDEETGRIQYIRVSYLLVLAAKCGIRVQVLGLFDGIAYLQYTDSTHTTTAKVPDYDFFKWFQKQMNDPCFSVAGEGKKVSDFMDVKKTLWTAGARSTCDMMHYKSCLSTALIGHDGKEHFNTVWLSSQNLDGIRYDGGNGNNNMQTGVVIYDHAEMYKVNRNYFDLQMKYYQQEDIYLLRDFMMRENERQYYLITNGRSNEIADDEQILYLGTPTDPVFEIHFTPVGGAVNAWDVRYNPFCTYTSKMLISEDWIAYTYMHWVWYDGPIAKIWQQIIHESFIRANNPKSKLRFLAVAEKNFDVAYFDDLVLGQNCCFKQIQVAAPLPWLHTKDVTVSWVEKGVRQYAVVQTSTNNNIGEYSYATNHMLVIKENDQIGHGFYDLFTRVTYVWSLPR